MSRAILSPCLPLVLLTATAAAQSHRLAHIDKVEVTVDLTQYPGEEVIDTSRVRTIMELRLRSAGLRVLSPAEANADPSQIPLVSLYLNILPVKMSGNVVGYACATRLDVTVEQFIPSTRAGVQFAAGTIGASLAPLDLWQVEYLELDGRSTATSDVEKQIGDRLDQLLNAWLADNPKR